MARMNTAMANPSLTILDHRRSMPLRRAGSTRSRADGAERERAVQRLHELLLRATRFEVGRRAAASPWLRAEREDLAQQSADDALVAVLAKLDEYRGASRFTTWAYKFALLEAGAKTRRRAWHGRQVALDTEDWRLIADSRLSPDRAGGDERAAQRRAGCHRRRAHATTSARSLSRSLSTMCRSTFSPSA